MLTKTRPEGAEPADRHLAPSEDDFTGHRPGPGRRAVGRRHGLGDSWLNEQAPTAIPRGPDARARTLYESSHLTVTGASAKHLLAMNLLAAREKDRKDIGVLCKNLGLQGPEDAIQIYRELFPEERVKPRARDALASAFRDRGAEYERKVGEATLRGCRPAAVPLAGFGPDGPCVTTALAPDVGPGAGYGTSRENLRAFRWRGVRCKRGQE